MYSNISKRSELLPLLQGVVNACTSKSVDDQRKSGECLKQSWSAAANPSATFLYYISKKHSTDGNSLKSFLRAVEMCNDDSCLLVLCRVINEIISIGSAKTRQKTHRKLIKADATSTFLRTLRCRLKDDVSCKHNKTGPSEEDTTLARQCDDSLAALVLAIGAEDCRLSFKIRVSGVLHLLCTFVASESEIPLSVTMVQLLCRSVRSPRNALFAGRHRGFATKLLVRISSLDDKDPVRNALLARYLEMLYFLIKIRKTRVHLIDQNIVGSIIPLLERHFWWRKESQRCSSTTSADVQDEICLMCLALLRLLSNIKRAKEQLVSCDVLVICDRIMVELDKETLGASTTAAQLQASFCALCLRCLPQIRFPITSSSLFRLCLPKPESLLGQCDESLEMCSGETSELRADEQSRDCVEESSDEQDEVLSKFDEDFGLIVKDVNEQTDNIKLDIVHSRLKISELQSYGCYFTEYELGAEAKHYGNLASYSESLEQSMLSTRSVIPFIKIAFPESRNPDVDLERQRHYEGVMSMRDVVVHEVARARAGVEFPSRVVFNLDSFAVDLNANNTPAGPLTCNDCARIGQLDSRYDHLLFESRFESGNLRRATQIGPNYYELILSPDINQRKEHYQWFYFEVSNIINDVVYTFEIVNCLKATSMYSKGMQPVMYSVRDAITGHPGWVRAGESVCYYRNLYAVGDCCETDEIVPRKRGFYSIRFNVTFRNRGDVCYFAYHFPYTFSYLKTTISRCLSQVPGNLYYSNQVIGESLGGNPVNLLTITASCSTSDIASKDCIFLSSRVHPGESNASWMMHGILETLLMSSEPLVEELRQKFVFKIVPILNPDGVINGSHRCSLSGVDLNRVWNCPDRTIHPEVYHTKAVIQYMCDMLKRPPFIFVDLHGHSRRANVFVLGNNPEESWRPDDKTLPNNYDFMELPKALRKNSAAFSYDQCHYGITKGKESSARVTIWRQFGVSKAYTMESTFFGFETGALKGFQIGTKDLKNIGRELLLGILEVWKSLRLSGNQNTQE